MRIVFALVLFMGIAIAGGAVYLAMEQFSDMEAKLANKEVKVEKIDLATVFIVGSSPLC